LTNQVKIHTFRGAAAAKMEVQVFLKVSLKCTKIYIVGWSKRLFINKNYILC